MARVAIGIAASDDANAHRCIGLKARAIAHGVTGLQILDGDEAAAQTEGGLQVPVVNGVLRKIWRAAVERNARSHPIGSHRRGAGVAQQACAVAGAALAGQVLGGTFKRSHLLGNAFVAIGIAEVGDEGNFIHLGQLVQACPGRSEAHRGKSQAVHSTVQFDEYSMRDLCFVAAEHVDLFIAMHGVPQVQTRAEFQIAGFKHTFQKQHRPAPTQGPYALRLVQVQQSKAIGGTQAFEHTFDAMAIGVGFDHRPDAGIGGSKAHALQVMTQRVGVNKGVYRAGHGQYCGTRVI